MNSERHREKRKEFAAKAAAIIKQLFVCGHIFTSSAGKTKPARENTSQSFVMQYDSPLLSIIIADRFFFRYYFPLVCAYSCHHGGGAPASLAPISLNHVFLLDGRFFLLAHSSTDTIFFFISPYPARTQCSARTADFGARGKKRRPTRSAC